MSKLHALCATAMLATTACSPEPLNTHEVNIMEQAIDDYEDLLDARLELMTRNDAWINTDDNETKTETINRFEQSADLLNDLMVKGKIKVIRDGYKDEHVGAFIRHSGNSKNGDELIVFIPNDDKELSEPSNLKRRLFHEVSHWATREGHSRVMAEIVESEIRMQHVFEAAVTNHDPTYAVDGLVTQAEENIRWAFEHLVTFHLKGYLLEDPSLSNERRTEIEKKIQKFTEDPLSAGKIYEDILYETMNHEEWYTSLYGISIADAYRDVYLQDSSARDYIKEQAREYGNFVLGISEARREIQAERMSEIQESRADQNPPFASEIHRFPRR
jgi:hypothetical protein